MRRPQTWIKLNRNILEWKWFTDPVTLQIFVFLLLSVSIEDEPFDGDVLHRGEICVSHEKLSKRLGLSFKQVRQAIENLKAADTIRTDRRIGKTLVISIVNFDGYQGQIKGQIKGQIEQVPKPLENQPLRDAASENRANKRANKRATSKEYKEEYKNIYTIVRSSNNSNLNKYQVPTLEEVEEYERTNEIGKDPKVFHEHYTSMGWEAQGHRVYDWKRLYEEFVPPEKVVKNRAEVRPQRFVDDGYIYELVNGEYTCTGRVKNET